MERWVPLAEVLQKPAKYGDISKREVAYIPDVQKASFNYSKTGIRESQRFTTELKHKYFPSICEKNQQLYLVAKDVTSQKLALGDTIGYENSEEIIKCIAELYGNKELRAKGVSWFRNFPKDYLKCSKPYWYGSKANLDVGKAVNYVEEVEDGWRLPYQLLYEDLPYEGRRGPREYSLPIRPLVCLDLRTLVKIDGTKDTPLQIRLPSKAEEALLIYKDVAMEGQEPFVVLQDKANTILDTHGELSKEQKEKLRNIIEQIGTLF